MSSKLPAIQFYVGDWLRDPIAGCSLAAQGLWLRMMIVAHDSDEYGRLVAGGNPLTERQIAARCGCSLRHYRKFFAELLSVKVPSVDKSGVIFCRRLVRDAERREAEKERKRELRRGNGGEFENLSRSCPVVVPPTSTEPVPSLSHRASSSSSSSTSPSTNNNTPQPAFDVVIPSLKEVEAKAEMIGCKPEWATEFFDYYNTQGWKKANGQPLTNWQTALKRWSDKNREPTAKGNAKGDPASTPGQTLYLLNGREQGLKSELEELEAYCYLEAGGGRSWDKPEQRKRFFELKRELKAIAKEKQNL